MKRGQLILGAAAMGVAAISGIALASPASASPAAARRVLEPCDIPTGPIKIMLYEGHWEGPEWTWTVSQECSDLVLIPAQFDVNLEPYFAAVLTSKPGLSWHEPYNRISVTRSSLDPGWNAFHYGYDNFEDIRSDWHFLVNWTAR